MPPVETPIPTPNYPAAHSMDTTWYAVDENGELAGFKTGSDGAAPVLEGMEEPSPLTDLTHNYSREHDYTDRYYRVEKHLEQHRLAGRIHSYESADAVCSFYYWRTSPKSPLTIVDLPEELQSVRHLLRLKNYDFVSREPIDPYEHVPQCYHENSGLQDVFPRSDTATLFPLPTLQLIGPKQFKEALSVSDSWRTGFQGRAFFAQDDDGFLALFRTDRFGAIPVQKYPGDPVRVTEDNLQYLWKDEKKYSELSRLRDISDMNIWRELVSTEPGNNPHPFLFERRMETETEWQARGPVHWLEYPFLPLGGTTPRLYGLYLFDASWHRPLPYFRVAAPTAPFNMKECPDDLIDRMSPVLLPGVRFAHSELIQPFELLPCFSVSMDSDDERHGWKYPALWIDSRLAAVHLCPPLPDSTDPPKFEGNIERLLRRARRHIQRVKGLALPPRT